MRYVDVGGARLSVIGLGTWQFGSVEWGYGRNYADYEAVAITHRALDLGVNLIDTAEIYGFGQSERIVGRAIASRRDEAFLATKVFPVFPVAPLVVQRAAGSARRLGTDHLDLYQVHWPNPVVPLATTMAGMRRLVDEGRIRYVGVSNFSRRRWESAESDLGGAVLTNQVSYSLVARKPEGDIIPWAQANDRIVIAYSPLAQGFLSGRYDESTRPSGVRAANVLFAQENITRARPLLDALRDIGRAHGATPAQIALAWTIRRPNVVAIPGASSVAQLESNVAAAEIELTDAEEEVLTTASDGFAPRRSPAAMANLFKGRFGSP